MDQTWAAERENQALSLVMKLEGQPFTYLGPNSFYHGKTGTFSLLNDMNCCGATDRILFAFEAPDCRKVLDAAQLESFYRDCRKETA